MSLNQSFSNKFMHQLVVQQLAKIQQSHSTSLKTKLGIQSVNNSPIEDQTQQELMTRYKSPGPGSYQMKLPKLVAASTNKRKLIKKKVQIVDLRDYSHKSPDSPYYKGKFSLLPRFPQQFKKTKVEHRSFNQSDTRIGRQALPGPNFKRGTQKNTMEFMISKNSSNIGPGSYNVKAKFSRGKFANLQLPSFKPKKYSMWNLNLQGMSSSVRASEEESTCRQKKKRQVEKKRAFV